MTICFQAAKYLFPFLIATCFFFFFSWVNLSLLHWRVGRTCRCLLTPREAKKHSGGSLHSILPYHQNQHSETSALVWELMSKKYLFQTKTQLWLQSYNLLDFDSSLYPYPYPRLGPYPCSYVQVSRSIYIYTYTIGHHLSKYTYICYIHNYIYICTKPMHMCVRRYL